MAMSTIDGEVLEAFAGSVSGSVLLSHDDGYEEARRIQNGLIDRRPAVIVRCAGAADIAEAIKLARSNGLEISVRGGGHNVAGRAVAEGGLMIDLSPMRGIHVDPAARTARAQGGVLWAELNREAHAHGLAVTGGAISSTGIAGYTLGGGLGWLMAKHGLGCDNLLGVELVTADGEILNVDDASHPDLMWALRGGGGNFGVAASLVYRLHPHSMVTGGLIAHPIDAAADMLRFYRDAVAGCSDDLTVFAAVVHAPDGSGMKLAAMVVFHTGDPDQAELDLAPFESWGSPLMVEVGPMPYPVMNTLLDAAYPKGALNYWLSSFTTGLPDPLIDAIVERFQSVPSPMTAILLEHFHGAVTRIDPTETAVPHRDEGWNLLLPSEWLDPAHTEANIAWTKDTFAALSEHFSGGRWLNYLGDDQDDAITSAYGPNYARLVEVKRRFDPDNVFHLNHNIVP
ncbi:MAG TPA: FAD-binding oxidoreductase [Gaiella sp.]|nr:FAD-binding oxidoreductase [Gaiella sp.]